MFNLIYYISGTQLTLTIHGKWARSGRLKPQEHIPQPFLTQEEAYEEADAQRHKSTNELKGTFRAVPV